MKDFQVTITRTEQFVLSIKADNYEEAEEKAIDVLDHEDTDKDDYWASDDQTVEAEEEDATKK